MHQKLYNAFIGFFHDMTLNELRLMNQNATASSVTYNTLLYYDLIATHPGEYTASSIADLLHVSKPAVITKVNEMIRNNYIYKKQSTHDKRVYYLFPNTEGLRDERLYKKIDDKVIEALKGKYSEDDLNKFCEILSDVGNLYREKGEHCDK